MSAGPDEVLHSLNYERDYSSINIVVNSGPYKEQQATHTFSKFSIISSFNFYIAKTPLIRFFIIYGMVNSETSTNIFSLKVINFR